MSSRRLGEHLEIDVTPDQMVIGSEMSVVGAAVVTSRKEAIELIGELVQWMKMARHGQ